MANHGRLSAWLRFGPIRRAREESGQTLIELLVGASLLAVVLIAALNSMDFAQTQMPKNVQYAQAISDATTGLQRMLQDIRQAYRINSTNGNPATGTGSWIDFNAFVGDRDLEIRYQCDQASRTRTGAYSCWKVSAATGQTMPSITSSSATLVIDRVLTSNGRVFRFLDSSGSANPAYPTYVEANVQVPASGSLKSGLSHTITLDDATSIPNLQNGS